MSNVHQFRFRRHVAALAVMLLGVASVRAQSFDDLHGQAEAAYSERKLDQALVLVDQAIQVGPKRFEGHRTRYKILKAMGRTREGNESWNRAEQILKDSLNDLQELRRAGAIELLDRAMAMVESNPTEAKRLIAQVMLLAPDLPGIEAIRARLPSDMQLEVKEIVAQREGYLSGRDGVIQDRAQLDRAIERARTDDEIRAVLVRLDLGTGDPLITAANKSLQAGDSADAKRKAQEALAGIADSDPRNIIAKVEEARGRGDYAAVMELMRPLASNSLFARDVIEIVREHGPSAFHEAELTLQAVIDAGGPLAETARGELTRLQQHRPEPIQPGVVDASVRKAPVFGQRWVAYCGIPLTFVPAQSPVPGGSAKDSDGPLDYWIADRWPTRKEWMDIMGIEVWPTSGALRRGTMEDLVADGVTYGQAVRFCALLTERDQGLLPEGYCYSLPTEAEHELAERAGNVRDIEPAGSKGAGSPIWEWCLATGKTWVARSAPLGWRETGTGLTWALPPGSTFRFVVAHRGGS